MISFAPFAIGGHQWLRGATGVLALANRIAELISKQGQSPGVTHRHQPR